jgi:hypothetical protein
VDEHPGHLFHAHKQTPRSLWNGTADYFQSADSKGRKAEGCIHTRAYFSGTNANSVLKHGCSFLTGSISGGLPDSSFELKFLENEFASFRFSFVPPKGLFIIEKKIHIPKKRVTCTGQHSL